MHPLLKPPPSGLRRKPSGTPASMPFTLTPRVMHSHLRYAPDLPDSIIGASKEKQQRGTIQGLHNPHQPFHNIPDPSTWQEGSPPG